MSHPLPALVSQLHRIATRSHALTLLDGTRAALNATGLAVYALGRERPPEAAWLRKTPLSEALAAAGTPLDFKTKSHYLAIQWRTLLSKGFLRRPNAPADPWASALRATAHCAWRVALPVIQRYDVVMADLLTRASSARSEYAERLVDDPNWVGLDDPDDLIRFDAHASYLLSLRRTADQPHADFCERLCRWFNLQLADALRARETQDFGHCLMRDHRSAEPCETCPETVADRAFVGIFDGDELFNLRKPRAAQALTFKTFKSDAPLPEGPEAPTILSFRWLLESRSRLDGIARFTLPSGQGARLINLRLLGARWKAIRAKSILQDYDVTTENGLAAAQRYMEPFLGGDLLKPATVPMAKVYLEAQWGDEQEFAADEPYLLAVSDAALIRRLARVGTRAVALAKAQKGLSRRPKRGEGPVRRTLQLTYAPAGGTLSHTITVVRCSSVGQTRRNFFSTPFPVHGGRTHPRERGGQGILVSGTMHWTNFALHKIARELSGADDPTYPWADEFSRWVDEQDAKLATDHAFTEALYAARLKDRVVAVTAGEKSHLGRFSVTEDDIIVEFFATAKRRKRVDVDAWIQLLQRLPGRTERGILRRYDELGKEYAFIHGYDAYQRSPFHRRFSATRKAQWRKEGCPP